MIRETILKLITENGKVKNRDLYLMGFQKDKVDYAFYKLSVEGVVVRHGSKRTSYYAFPETIDNTDPIDHSITLPDLPDILLNWMGYTNRKPLGAYKIEGILSISRGAE